MAVVASSSTTWIHKPPEMEREIRLLCQDQPEHVQRFRDEEIQRAAATLTSGGFKTLIDDLSPQNCLEIRGFSTLLEISQLTKSCDAFIRANFARMLNEDHLIRLPRVQVNVDVSAHLTSLDTRSVDCDLIERIVASVVCELSAHASPLPCQLVEEKLVVMELQADLTVQIVDVSNERKTPTGSSPLKHKPSPLNSGKTKSTWEVLATYTIGTGAMAVVRYGRELLVLNVQTVSSPDSVICPISPTTGIPLAVNDAFFSQMVRSRSGFGLATVGDTLMSVGGYGRGGVFHNCECFDLHANTWAPSCDLTTPRARLAVVQCDDKIYALGGSDGKTDLNSMEVSCESGGWKKMTSTLCTARSDFDAAVLGGCIYAVGGAHYSTPLRSAEAFDPIKKEWKRIAFMSVPRRGLSVVSCNGSIYAIGGQASSWGCLNIVECYNPMTNQWERVAPMAMPRRNACAVVIEDRIYVIGGYNGSSTVNVVEVYDPATDTWTNVCPMVLKRSNAAAVLLNDAIYVVGGFSGSLFLNSLEKYDSKSGQWTSYSKS